MGFEIIINLPAFDATVSRQAKNVMEDTLFDLRAIMIEEFGGEKTGRIYRRPSGPYQASAPGEPPAIRTGNLLRSISEPQVIKSGNSVVGRLVIAAPYAWDLERGTGRIAPRPFIKPAIDTLLKRIGGRG